MQDPTVPKLSTWPFFLGDALLLGLAAFVCFQSKSPLGQKEIFFYLLCVALGAVFGILPFLIEYRALLKLTEANSLVTVVSQIQNLKKLAAQISGATAHWQTAQESADKTSNAAKAIAQQMSSEAKAFSEFMQKMNDGEKSNLRLEVEKFHRAETEWLQVIVRMLDHVYALYRAAVRSGQAGLVEELGNFQNACRDTARRVGLAPFVAASQEPFDSQRHRNADGETTPAADATVEETIATGYTFQGKLLRPALVRLRKPEARETLQPVSDEPQSVPTEESEQLPL